MCLDGGDTAGRAVRHAKEFGRETLSLLCRPRIPNWTYLDFVPKPESVTEGRELLRWPDIGHVSAPGRSSSLEEFSDLTGKAWVACPFCSQCGTPAEPLGLHVRECWFSDKVLFPEA